MKRDKPANKVAVIGVSRQEVDRAIATALGKGTAEELGNMKPSPTMKVHFGDGTVLAMNRRDRRRNHLYGGRLVRSRV